MIDVMTGKPVLSLRSQPNPDNANFQMVLFDFSQIHDGKIGIIEDLKLKLVEQGEVVDPTFHLSFEDAQQLMDEFWKAGIRPSSADFTNETLEAKNQHLEDMRLFATAFWNKLSGAPSEILVDKTVRRKKPSAKKDS